MRFAPQAQPHDTYIRGILLTFFLIYDIIEMRSILKMKSRRAGRLISYCGSSLPLFSFFIENEIEAIRANLRKIS